MALKLANDASSTLAAGIADTDLSLSVQPADAAYFPSLLVGDWFPAVLEGGGDYEIIKVTARAADVFTIERAQEGTAAVIWPAGTRIDLRATAAALLALSSSGSGTSSNLLDSQLLGGF